MSILEIVLLSIGLAMDCFAVSVCKGVSTKQFAWVNVLKMALIFGVFQGIMPLIGFAVGIGFAEHIKIYDHWIAFALLGIIGGKMIYEGLKPESDHCDNTPNPYRLKIVLSLALATSIDALASGIVFVPTPQIIWLAITIIAFVSFVFSLVGSLIGYHSGKHLKFNVEILGGIILIFIGLKILIEHLMGK
jgi:putative Mn2+ efflux pump MntP